MTIYDSFFPLGFGTNRFIAKGTNDIEGIEKSAELVTVALNAGVQYIDVAQTYSRGMAFDICKKAFANKTNFEPKVTVKSSYSTDKTSDDAIRRVEKTLASLGLDKAFCFVCWSIFSYDEFLEIMKKGGVYDGALKAKDRGLVDHICFSTHASPNDIVKIIDSKAFEGVTISFSVLNASAMKSVLDCAEKNSVGVVVMNPLAGGIIPQNLDYYKFLCSSENESPTQAALRYVYAHPAIKIVLSGMSSIEQLEENLKAFKNDAENPADRIARVDKHLSNISGYCTGCRYCDSCPKNIPIFELMQSYNASLFPYPKKLYNRDDPKLLESISITQKLKNTFGMFPDSSNNPCIACGRCESKCTAHLSIISRLKDLYGRFAESCFSKEDRLNRLRELIANKRKIAFYPGGGYTVQVLSLVHEAFPGIDFDISIFDTNSNIWGNIIEDCVVQNPEEITNIKPELVIVSNYNYSEEIYNSLIARLPENIPVAKLHKADDVPWVF